MSCDPYDRVDSLALWRDVESLGTLLKGHFRGAEVRTLGLQHFLEDGMRLRTGSDFCLRNNFIIVTAQKKLQLVLRLYFADEFERATYHIVDSLEGVDRPLELVPAGRLLRTMEAILARYFRGRHTGPHRFEECSDALREAPTSFLADTDT